MALSVCPAAMVAAPLETVWELLTEPSDYHVWSDAHLERREPEGPIQAGQTLHLSTRGFGRRWPVTMQIESVDESRHQIALRTMLPLGLVLHNHISCATLSPSTTRVAFG